MNKLGTALGGLLLIGALAAPVAFAHYDSGSHPAAAVVDELFGDYTPNASNNRVAGWFVGSQNAYLSIANPDGVSTAIPQDPGQFCPDDVEQTEDVDEALLCEDLTNPINPGFFLATFGGLGDVEVGGLGGCYNSADEVEQAIDATAVLNEKTVDGATGSTDSGDAQVEDSLWNDGGQSYIAHTGHYDCALWNTHGCGPNAAQSITGYSPAFGEDVSGLDLWLGTLCSWGAPVAEPSPGLVDVLNEFVGDVTNCPLGGFPQSCLDAVNYLDDCGLGDLLPTLLPGAAAPDCVPDSDGGIVCDNGSIGDTNFGNGAPAGAGVAFDKAGDGTAPVANCDSVATASVFPFTAVVATAVEDESSPLTWSLAPDPYVSLATFGWVG